MLFDKILIVLILLCIVLISACRDEITIERPNYNTFKVKASAYNNVSYQTDRGPALAAWGDTLEDGMKVIAVSRDLLDSGLTHNTRVYIKELESYYTVKDKMHYRWRKKIDVFMGKDIKAAKKFGIQEVTLTWGF